VSLAELRISLRTLCRYPAFTALAVVTLALGIGSATAIFSVVKAVLLNHLPYRGADRVMAVGQVESAALAGQSLGGWMARELVARTRSIESISLYGDTQRTLVENGDAEVLRGLRAHYFGERGAATGGCCVVGRYGARMASRRHRPQSCAAIGIERLIDCSD
jgi:hypothetical protein